MKTAEHVNKIGNDGVIAGSSIIAETENSALMESVIEVQIEENCVTLHSPSSTVDIFSDSEDNFLVEGEGSTDSRLSYAENKREIAEVKNKVKIVVPELENYLIETIVDCPNNFQVKDMKRKRSDETMEVKVRNDLFPARIMIPEDLISRKKSKSKISKSLSKSKSQSLDQNLNMKDTVQDKDQVGESEEEAN